jgi:hypothetical protein
MEPEEPEPVERGWAIYADGTPTPQEYEAPGHEVPALLKPPLEQLPPTPTPRAYIGRANAPGPVTWWDGHIEDRTRDRVEQREGTLEELVRWARERTGWVLILEDPLYWAGTDPKPDDVPLYWHQQR